MTNIHKTLKVFSTRNLVKKLEENKDNPTKYLIYLQEYQSRLDKIQLILNTIESKCILSYKYRIPYKVLYAYICREAYLIPNYRTKELLDIAIRDHTTLKITNDARLLYVRGIVLPPPDLAKYGYNLKDLTYTRGIK